ncbi:MAG: biopolymer transporter ExbB [Paracoccus sp. (in: a-proteobacteria)]
MMLIVLGLVGTGGWFAYGRILPIFAANPWLNGLILGVFVIGVLACFWQVAQLVQSASWIERFAERRRNAVERNVAAMGAGEDHTPRLLAPLAALLGVRGSAGGAISTGSARSILDSVATRIDEARDITRYLSNLLIFLGLLGTFYGLATTVPAVVDTIRALAPQEGETGIEVFDKLMSGLEAQLGGMATAFSSSLLGLAGSLVVGLLELFATHGQNRFYRELEEWLSGFTRLGMSGDDGEQLDQAAILGLFSQVGGQMADLQDFYAERDEIREREVAGIDERVLLMARNVENLGQVLAEDSRDGLARMDGVAQAMNRMNEGQARLADAVEQRPVGLDDVAGALTSLAEGQERLIRSLEAGSDRDEARMHLRSIDDAMGRLVEETAATRHLSTDDLRREIVELTEALRGLGQP